MSKFIGYCVVMVTIFTAAIVFVGEGGYCVNNYLFSDDGNYQIRDSNYGIIKEGNIYNETVQENQEIGIAIKATDIYKIVYIEKQNRILFLIGQGRENKYYGFLIFQIEPMKFVHFLEMEINISESSVNVLTYEKGDRFYISYWTKQNGDFKPKTEAFSLKTFELVQDYSNVDFVINQISCIIDDELFNGQLFDMKTGEKVMRTDLPFKYFIYDCKNGIALGISSTTISEPVTLVVSNLKADPMIKKEIKTHEFIIGFSGQGEWRLSNDAKYIIRDERKEEGETGRLVFWSLESGKKTELKIVRKSPYGGGILGFSLSGKLLFYDSIDKLNVIDIQTQKVIKEILLPFRPVGIIWP
jgi:hypothetical protein